MSANATASGSPTIIFYPWGNGDGSTTFNVPDFQTASSIGSGGTAGTVSQSPGTKIGQYGGEQQHVQLAAEVGTHNHPPLSGAANFFTNRSTTAFTTAGSVSIGTDATTGNNTSGGNPFNVYHPVAVVNKIIKT